MVRQPVQAAPIRTPRLTLVPCELRHVDAILRNDRAALAAMVNADVPAEFPNADTREVLPEYRRWLAEDPDLLGWMFYLIRHDGDRRLIGEAGYTGQPDDAGHVGLGFAVIPAYRGHGIASEAARGLVDHAFSFGRVRSVGAETHGDAHAANHVLEKVGLTVVRRRDADDGGLLEWAVTRAQWPAYADIERWGRGTVPQARADAPAVEA
ncbi:MAG TPA: GNAT family N-acetyltransferase [Tepidisphaeraceae bacterium]|nr:GNAT family N-acetyltransferase [Tepidisphaeraceae bacterium]